MAMRFPITDLLDHQESCDFLLRAMHPKGLECPHGHPLLPDQAPHERHRDPIFDYRCRACGAVFNLFTGTAWSGTHYDCRVIVLLMRGFAQGVSTLQLSQELELDRATLLERRHKVQNLH